MVELELNKRTDDFRPESHSPLYYDFRDLKTFERLGTENNWQKRKELCLRKVYTNIAQLIEDSKSPNNISLATFKPAKILGFKWTPDDREWKNEWKELRKQGDLFVSDKPPEILIPKLPYKFYYHFQDDSNRECCLMIEDWEIGALYWKCLKTAGGDESVALKKVREKYEVKFLNENDIWFFLGTTKEWHMRRAKNPFVIIGVFYPKRVLQPTLF